MHYQLGSATSITAVKLFVTNHFKISARANINYCSKNGACRVKLYPVAENSGYGIFFIFAGYKFTPLCRLQKFTGRYLPWVNWLPIVPVGRG